MISFIFNFLLLWLFVGIGSIVLSKFNVIHPRNEMAKELVFWLEFPANFLWKLFNKLFKIG